MFIKVYYIIRIRRSELKAIDIDIKILNQKLRTKKNKTFLRGGNMKILSLEKNGKRYKAYISPDGYGSYEYMIYEVIHKKHWWSLGKRFLGSGVILKNIKDEIINHIDREIKHKKSIDCLAEQYDKL